MRELFAIRNGEGDKGTRGQGRGQGDKGRRINVNSKF